MADGKGVGVGREMAAILVTVAPATCPSNFDLINIQNHLCTVLSLNLVCT